MTVPLLRARLAPRPLGALYCIQSRFPSPDPIALSTRQSPASIHPAPSLVILRSAFSSLSAPALHPSPAPSIIIHPSALADNFSYILPPQRPDRRPLRLTACSKNVHYTALLSSSPGLVSNLSHRHPHHLTVAHRSGRARLPYVPTTRRRLQVHYIRPSSEPPHAAHRGTPPCVYPPAALGAPNCRGPSPSLSEKSSLGRDSHRHPAPSFSGAPRSGPYVYTKLILNESLCCCHL